MILVVMGVSGSGKTTIGVRLADRLGCAFHDADDYHPAENVEKMSRGEPLTDEDRLPWLANLRNLLLDAEREGRSLVLACSALREAFRRSLEEGVDDVRFIHLRGDRALIAGRLAERKGHYMPPSLLDSQFAALEEPEDALVVDISGEPDEIVSSILHALKTETLFSVSAEADT